MGNEAEMRSHVLLRDCGGSSKCDDDDGGGVHLQGKNTSLPWRHIHTGRTKYHNRNGIITIDDEKVPQKSTISIYKLE